MPAPHEGLRIMLIRFILEYFTKILLLRRVFSRIVSNKTYKYLSNVIMCNNIKCVGVSDSLAVRVSLCGLRWERPAWHSVLGDS